MVKKETRTEAQPGKAIPADQQVENQLVALREEYRKLHEKKIATERDRQNLEERLKELRQQAEQEYGTSDLEQLRELLEQRRQENERMVAEYEQHVREINERLGQIESAVKEGSSSCHKKQRRSYSWRQFERTRDIEEHEAHRPHAFRGDKKRRVCENEERPQVVSETRPGSARACIFPGASAQTPG